LDRWSPVIPATPKERCRLFACGEFAVYDFAVYAPAKRRFKMFADFPCVKLDEEQCSLRARSLGRAVWAAKNSLRRQPAVDEVADDRHVDVFALPRFVGVDETSDHGDRYDERQQRPSGEADEWDRGDRRQREP